jgi:NAD(P)-dependent dehydrogenase (short-subunit alcohol dehydrogenase family)
MATCLITGANRGIGLELARTYAASGLHVLATARDPANATALRALKAEYPTLEILPLDVTVESDFARLATTLQGRPIDLLIANAGLIGPRGPMDDPANTAALWAQVLAVNVTGVFFTARALAPNLKAARHAKLAILSSRMASSVLVSGTSYLYRAAKAATANLGANLAVEFKPAGIAVGIYHPGWVKTDMGGPGADIAPAASAKGLKARIDHLSLATTAVFEDYTGAPIAF